MQELEIEFKNLLTKEEFYHLLASYPFPPDGETQINYYFETKDKSLQRQLAALRIREKNNQYKLTLKEQLEDAVLETHDQLTREEAHTWLQGKIIPKPNITKQLMKMNIDQEKLEYFGSLTTKRRELKLNNVLLVLDISTYNGHKDYELELEAQSKIVGLNHFHSLLNKHHIPQRKTQTKIERFFSTYYEND